MRSDERRLRVLQAIVEDYVHTREPVGSKTLTERHNFDVSPATIRNDMAALEEIGLIHQPHTSAGRVPTDSGYRTFVDSIAQLKPLSAAERQAIERWLDGAVDIDDVVLRAGRLLAQLTHQLAIVQYPDLDRMVLRRIEILTLSERLSLLVIITEAGRVEQRTLELGLTPERARMLSTRLSSALSGASAPEVELLAYDACADLERIEREAAAIVAGAVAQAMSETGEERFVLAGTANLARTTPDFPRSISPVLDALEEQMVLMRLFAELSDDLTITIGAENPEEGLAETSVITSSYGIGSARLGIVGPTRMDYPTTMASVRAVARYLTKILGS